VTTADYRVLVCDLRTDRLLDVLPIGDVSVDDFIGKAGSLAGTVPIPNRAMAERVRPILQPGRTALWVERDGAVWWGGILWTATPAADERGRVTVAVQGGTFDSYLDHRTLFESVEARGVDQFDLARDLVEYAQSLDGGDIGIEYGTATSGVTRTRRYDRHDQPRIRELLDELAETDNGFEWRIRAHRDTESGRRVKLLELGHPVIRRGGVDLVLTHPGDILTYTMPTDGTARATVWQSRGATVNTNAAAESRPLLSRLFVDSEALADGWPRLDGTSDYTSTENPEALDQHARADFTAARRPRAIPELTIRLDQRITPDLIGRTVRVRIRDLWHANGHDARYRVVGINVSPPERGRPESAQLTLEAL
jgi:hypothetical protein